MSESNLVSPLLDGFALGAPMSNRPGVCCCPAMKEGSDQKYIVKILSVPPSQTQLDALLVTGAYKDPAAALDYFRQQADDAAAEAEFLQSMAALDGFQAYDGWQVTPMKKNRLGYHVYLVSKYSRTLEKNLRRTAITHLQAVNMALDLCRALSLCRRAGHLYVDLKPTNVVLDETGHYRIADLGFVSTRFLSYTSMPEKYLSPYSAPETRDPMATLNQTVDTYALGLILYRIYNGGKLPELPEDPQQPLEAPAYADEAMTAIILKALSPAPEDRYQDPADFGKALADYLQTAAPTDEPIAPPVPEAPQAPVKEPEDTAADTAEATSAPEETVVEAPVPEEAAPQEPVPAAPAPESGAEDDTFRIPDFTDPLTDVTDFTETEEALSALDDILPGSFDVVPEAAASQASVSDSTIRMDFPESSAPQPDESVLNQGTVRFSPAGAAVQEPEDDVVFPVITPKTEDSFDLDSELNSVKDLLKTPKYPEMKPHPVRKPVMQNVTPVDVEKNRRGKAPLVITLLLVLAVGVGFFFNWFYRNFYLLTVTSISVTGTQDEMTVTLNTDAADSLLTVSCTDAYGNTMTSPVSGGKAVFTGLSPNALYNVLVNVDGLHKLTGQISDVFTTEGQTEIVSLTAVTGQEEGSVLLSLTISGHEPEGWIASAACEGEDNVMQNFTGHSVTLKGLRVGKEYTIRITASDNSQLAGQTSIKYTVLSLISASNLDVISRLDGDLTIGWDGPATPVASWTVRCYSDDYDETQTVTGTIATFRGTSNDKAYTIEVTPAGMTQPTRLNISANPITITAFDVTENDEGGLDVSWSFDGKAPADGWLLMYAMGSSTSSSVIKCSEAQGTIAPKVPGTTYNLTLQLTDDTSIFGGTQSYTTAAPEGFSTQGLSADKITSKLLKTPGTSWLADDVKSEDYTNSFQSGDNLSMVLEATVKFYVQHEDISVMYVYRDSDGNPIPSLISTETLDWYDLFFDGNYQLGELDLPKAPTEAGSYSVTVYFNGSPVANNNFTIS